MLTGMQIMFHIFSFFNINKTQGHTMNSSDLLLVELYNDNVKIFNHAWEETLLALGSDLDVKKNQEATTDLRSMAKDIL